jgi:plasmid rolling circle replication initiator protein Rep
MDISDSDRILKRINGKRNSTDLGAKIYVFTDNNYPEDKKMLKRMQRQMNCNNKLIELKDGRMITMFCNNKTCHICNSLRLVKFLKKYLDQLKIEPVKYNMVLTVRNPRTEDLKKKIDRMYSFFRNSGLKKDKTFKRLKNEIKVIRSFETTFNKKRKTYNIHFHFLLAGKNRDDVKLFGKTIIKYWRKYFRKDANSNAQYLRLQRKSELENFKYLLKLQDVNDGTIHMLYHLLKAIHGRRLFGTMNIKPSKTETNQNKYVKIEYKKLKRGDIVSCYYYSVEVRNYYNSNTKELLENDKLIKDAKRIKVERKHQKIVSEYFKDVSKKNK